MHRQPLSHRTKSQALQYDSRSDIEHRQNLNIERRRKRLSCECLGSLQDEHADHGRRITGRKEEQNHGQAG